MEENIVKIRQYIIMYDKTTIMQIAIIVIGIVITLYLGIKEKRKMKKI